MIRSILLWLSQSDYEKVTKTIKAYENINTAVISRLSYDGTTENIIKVSIEEDIELKRGDRIRIAADQTKRKDYKS